jgi:hypothetical protein
MGLTSSTFHAKNPGGWSQKGFQSLLTQNPMEERLFPERGLALLAGVQEPPGGGAAHADLLEVVRLEL